MILAANIVRRVYREMVTHGIAHGNKGLWRFVSKGRDCTVSSATINAYIITMRPAWGIAVGLLQR
jgi:hypothetical protein